jgi:hypothetical protein
MDKKQFFIRSWLRGSNVFEKETGAILLFKKETVFNWIDKDVAKRAWYIASIIPKDLSANSAKCWTTSILNKYGDREDVRSNLSANYSTEGFSGKASLYYKSKKDKFGSILQRENNPKVKKWLKEYIKQIEYNIKRETIAEERDDRY